MAERLAPAVVSAGRRPVVSEGVTGLHLPLGQRVALGRRGTTFVRDVAGPSDSERVPVILCHGWFASGGLNWFGTFDELSAHGRVVAPDFRGHGRGITSLRPFRLADCAEDTLLTMDALGIERAILVGYSMGGPIAQLMWRQAPERVAGLVFAATAARFIPVLHQRMAMTALMVGLAGTTRASSVFARLPRRLLPDVPGEVIAGSGTRRGGVMATWAVQEFRRHSLRHLAEAGHAIATYSSRRWIDSIDVPTTVVITTTDRSVLPVQQAQLALSIRGSTTVRYGAGHASPVLPSFGPVIASAVESVADRIARSSPGRT